jgi:enoyl-CoA hydratase/carnithine racemase
VILRLRASQLVDRHRTDPMSLTPAAGVAAVLVLGWDLDPSEVRSLGPTVLAPPDSIIDPAVVDGFYLPEFGVAIDRLAASCPIAFSTAAKVARVAERSDPRDALFVESVTYSLLQTGGEFQRWLDGNRRDSRRKGRESSVVDIRREGDCLHISLDEPDRRNAFSGAMRDELREALTLAVIDRTIDRVILRGNGTNFSSGGDLTEFGTATSPVDAHLTRTTDSVSQLLLALSARLGDRLECRIHGANAGAGVELAAFAGSVVASPDATFRLPEVEMGLIPGAGGTVSITNRIGRHRAVTMMLSGSVIDATTALEWGLVDAIEEWR